MTKKQEFLENCLSQDYDNSTTFTDRKGKKVVHIPGFGNSITSITLGYDLPPKVENPLDKVVNNNTVEDGAIVSVFCVSKRRQGFEYVDVKKYKRAKNPQKLLKDYGADVKAVLYIYKEGFSLYKHARLTNNSLVEWENPTLNELKRLKIKRFIPNFDK